MMKTMQKFKGLKNFTQDLLRVRQLWPFFKTMRPLIILAGVLGLLCAFIESLSLGLIIMIILKSLAPDVVLPVDGFITPIFSFLTEITGENFIAFWAIIIGAIILKSITLGAYNFLSAFVTNTIHHKIRAELFEKYMALPYKDLAKLDFGTMTNALQIECWYVAEAVRALSGILICLCAILIYICVIMSFSWPVGLVAVLLGVLVKAVLAGLKQPLRKLGQDVTRINEALALRMYTRMQALKTIRAHGLEKREAREFVELSDSVAKAFTRMSLVETYVRPIHDTAVLFILAVIIGYSSALGNPAAMTATVIALLYRLQPYVYALEGALMTLAKSQGPLDAVIKQLQTPDIRSEKPAVLEPPEHWKGLRFEGVSFAYDQEPVLQNLNFEIKGGSVVWIKGLSGAGKSTLINLILKLARPNAGRIWLDDTPFEEINRSAWLAGLAAAGQDFELLDGTLLENLTLGRSLDQEDVGRALELAEIKAFVDQLPEGLNTRIGERGIRLSGGQRQRIVLARALASKPALLVLDEATSAVSLDIERKIYKNIRAEYPNMTLIIITHRTLDDGYADLCLEI